MHVIDTNLSGLKVLQPKVFRDERGFFLESYNINTMRDAGISDDFVQDNHSRSRYGTIRALHFQGGDGQSKLVRCTLGRVYDVVVDIRPDSPTLGRYFGIELSAKNFTMLYIPAGFAHGFCALSDVAEFCYKCSTVYNADLEAGIRFDDPDINITWPVANPVLSDRDRNNQSFAGYLAGIHA